MRSGDFASRAFHEAGEDADIAVTVPFGCNAYSLVSAGIGIAIVDGFTAVAGKAFGLHVVKFDCADQLDVVIMQNRERPVTKTIEVLIELLHETAAAMGGAFYSTKSIGSTKSTNSSSSGGAVLPHQHNELGRIIECDQRTMPNTRAVVDRLLA